MRAVPDMLNFIQQNKRATIKQLLGHCQLPPACTKHVRTALKEYIPALFKAIKKRDSGKISANGQNISYERSLTTEIEYVDADTCAEEVGESEDADHDDDE